MRSRHIVILALLVALLASCSQGTITAATLQTTPAAPEQTTAIQTATAPVITNQPTQMSPTPIPTTDGEPQPVIQTPEPIKNYYIIVDKEDNAFGIFECGEDGEPKTLVKTFPCALGRSSRMTPTGTFKIGDKGRWKKWSEYKKPRYSPYYTYYTYVNGGYSGGLYFHGPQYSDKSGDKLIAETYEEIGKNVTSGCVRTTTEGAYWVYTYCPKGTVVKIEKSSDLVSWPGLPEIDTDFPTWDPTDPEKPN